MVTKSNSWLRDNVMGIIIAVMFTAFWVQYESDRRQEIADKKEYLKLEEKQDDQVKIITRTLIQDPDTKPDDKEELREYLKLETRGVTVN